MRYGFLIILFICNSKTSCIFAQQPFNYSFRHITQADGLLHNQVVSITQDGKGFIWVVTPYGLQRYDGAGFTNYPGMLNNFAGGLGAGTNLYADKKSNFLWITNYTGIRKMEPGKNNFTAYNAEKLLGDSALGFTDYRGVNNKQWLLGNHAVYYYDSVTKKYTGYFTNIFPANTHQAAYSTTDSSGNYKWVTVLSQLYLFDKKNKKVYTHDFNPDNHPLLQLVIEKRGRGLLYVMADSRKNIWLTTWGDVLYKYDAITKKISIYNLSNIKSKETNGKTFDAFPLISCMLEDDNHTLWIGTANTGLLRYNPEQDNFDYCITKEKDNESIWYNYSIFSLFQDKEQNIWVGTDKGISIFNPYRQNFKSVRHEQNNHLSINKSEIINFIQAANGDIFIGTWGGGIGVYDKQLNFKKNIFLKGPWEINYVWSFAEVDDTTLWMGCQHGYIQIYNTVTGKIKTIHPPQMDNCTIYCMEKDNEGNIWFGLHNGKITKWDKAQNKFFACADSLKSAAPAQNIFIDQSQHCWVSTWEGFKEFDLKKRMYSNTWLHDKNNTGSIAAKICRGIEEYNDSTLLIGTVGGGLNFFNKNTKVFSHFNTASGLPSDNIYAIKKDAAGYIWFTTDYGLYKFNPADKKVIPYSIDQGLINSSFLSNKFHTLQDGQWLTFTTAEAIIFSPFKMERENNLKPKTEITGFKLFDKPFFIDSILIENKPLRLSYKENFFSVEFAALNFSNLQQTNYYYRLSGIDKDWVNSGAKRFASYTDLQPGEYIFDVKAENGNSIGAITSFKIIIAPPFWKTRWFIALIFFSIFLLTYLFLKWRIKNIKAVAEEKLKVQQLNAAQYKSKLELEQIVNYFSSSLIDKNTVDDVLWDVTKNLIAQLGFVDCIMYLWNDDKTKMIQKAGIGPKGSVEEINKKPFDVLPGQGVVGYVIQTKEAVLIPDTTKDKRYREDEETRLSEITVPVIYNNELIGIIDSEHPEKNFFTQQHLQLLVTMATLVANKIKSIEAEELLQQKHIEMYSMNEQLSTAKLEALRSQMNPHFIFNCINSIDALIQSNDKYNATLYLNKFAKLLRNILDSSNQNSITFSKDIDTLKLYIELEELRNENKFKTTFSIDKELLESDYKVPPLIVQPFVENAILHGLKNRDGEHGILTIDIKKINEQIQYTITDNGIGRKAAEKIMQNKESHYGMQISNDRIKLFNKEETASVQINDLYNNQAAAGTTVTVNLNII
jgi:LytS/YehU family sensor histidine kinase/ligand-binding sensor domain-containing protein